MSDAAEPSADLTAGDRYASLTKMLAKNRPLSLATYLQAQTLFVMMDLLSEAQEQRAVLEDIHDLVREVVVHRTVKK